MAKKNAIGMGAYLHPDVHFVGPLASMHGKEVILKAAGHFFNLFKTLTIREKLGENNLAMIVMDFESPEPVGHWRSANLVTVEGGRITRLELFYDARPFEQKGIFS